MNSFITKALTTTTLLAGLALPTFAAIASSTQAQVVVPATAPVTPPSPSPSPTPVPVTPPVTTPPVIKTDSLKNGRVGRIYEATLGVYDTDGDVLTMSVANLPSTLTFETCTQATLFGVTKLACKIAGVPTETGTYELDIRAYDGKNTTTKVLTLEIN